MNPTDAYAPAPKKARVEIIPLIDVIFFLLATFVLFTLSLNKIHSIDLILPQPGDISTAIRETAYLQATEDGAFFWKIGEDAAPEYLTAAELPARLASYRRQAADPRVLVRGDNKAHFGGAITALDAVRTAGIAQVSVETLVSATGR
ncbi:MAG: biopolymer transporter ExbD [Verrucomicrobia bacterium]|nr:biopolymer transporter ExbD [Verrucomicrobiota bacterium]